LAEDSPLTVAGAAAALSSCLLALRSLLIPRRGTVAQKISGKFLFRQMVNNEASDAQ